jgi:hypothetical protein
MLMSTRVAQVYSEYYVINDKNKHNSCLLRRKVHLVAQRANWAQ